MNHYQHDRALSIEILGRYINANDREVLAKTYAFYLETWESPPTVRREGIQQADNILEGKTLS
jgi:hypothetical protein